jgi:CYTH domain-containing protein
MKNIIARNRVNSEQENLTTNWLGDEVTGEQRYITLTANLTF